MKMDVSIIIVSYNTLSLLKDCLNSIFVYTEDVKFEVIVVDNASNDGSQQMVKDEYQKVKLIESSVNLGFGKANNLGAKSANGKYFFLLNSDCLLIENTIKAFYEFMEENNSDETIGAIGALLFDKLMNLNTSYHKFPTLNTEINWITYSKINKLFHQTRKFVKTYNYSQSQADFEVEFITGADLFIPRKIFEKLNGFDEKFFLFFEETDLQKSMEINGLKRIILVDQKIIHLEGRSTKATSQTLKSVTIFRDSMYKYFKKNSSFFGYLVFYLAITPLICFPLFRKKYSPKEKNGYCKMLFRRSIDPTNL